MAQVAYTEIIALMGNTQSAVLNSSRLIAGLCVLVILIWPDIIYTESGNLSRSLSSNYIDLASIAKTALGKPCPIDLGF